MDILQRMPWMAQDAVFKKLSEIAEVASLDKEERKKYDESLRAYRDTIVVMEGQFMAGERKGREEEKLNIAKKLKAKGMSAEEIAEMTGIAVGEIEHID